MVKFEDLSLAQLRQIARDHNKHYLIKNFSTLSKKDLIVEIKKYLTIDENNIIKSIQSEYSQNAPFTRKEKSTFSKAYYDIINNPFLKNNIDPKQLEFYKEHAKPKNATKKQLEKIKDFVDNFEERIKEKPKKKSPKNKSSKKQSPKEEKEIDPQEAIKQLQEMISKKENDIKFWNKKLEGGNKESLQKQYDNIYKKYDDWNTEKSNDISIFLNYDTHYGKKDIMKLMKKYNIDFKELKKKYNLNKIAKEYFKGEEINTESLNRIQQTIEEKTKINPYLKELQEINKKIKLEKEKPKELEIMKFNPEVEREKIKKIVEKYEKIKESLIKEKPKEMEILKFNLDKEKEKIKKIVDKFNKLSKKEKPKDFEILKFNPEVEREKIKKIVNKTKDIKFELPKINEKMEEPKKLTEKEMKKMKLYDLEKIAINLKVDIREGTRTVTKTTLIKRLLEKFNEKDEDDDEEDSNKEIIKKNDELISLTNKIFTTPTGRLKYYKDKFDEHFYEITGIKENFVSLIKDAQKTHDFYPTPEKCLEPFKHWIKQSTNILEPCAGLGYITNFVRRNKEPDDQITLIEYNSDFKYILGKMNPDCYIEKEGDFLDYNNKNKFDCIIMNPPYGLGTDKKYYLDFVFHAMYLLSEKSSVRKLKNLLLVVPNIIKNSGSDFQLSDILLYTGKAKLQKILNKYMKVTKSQIDKLFIDKNSIDHDCELYEEIENLFGFFYGTKIGECNEFVNTKFKANLYQIQITYSLSGSGKKIFNKKPKSDGYALHAVLVKKSLPFEEAFKEAQHIIKKKKFFHRETKNEYRFRNLPKQKFESKSFKSKKVNDKITLVFGKLKPEHMHLEGSGLFDWIKQKASSAVNAVSNYFKPREDYNNLSKKTIADYGNVPIKQLYIMRAPVQSMLNNIINFVSLGKWNELKQKYNFDKLFHLSLVARLENGKSIIMEKNEVLNITPEFKNEKDAETLDIPFNGQLTINQILDTARKNVGDQTFFLYDAFKNNCQYFIKYLLEGQNLYSEQAKNFLFQDLQQIYEGLPSYVPKVMKGATTMGAIVNKILGKGKDKIIMNPEDFIKEHKHLIHLLRQTNEPKLLAEANDQAKELKQQTGVNLLGKGKKKKIYH